MTRRCAPFFLAAILLGGCGSPVIEAPVAATPAPAPTRVALAPTVDSSSDAALEASLQRIDASLDEDRKRRFQADCITVTMKHNLKQAFGALLSGGEKAMPTRSEMFRPLGGKNADQVHEMAEELRAEDEAGKPEP